MIQKNISTEHFHKNVLPELEAEGFSHKEISHIKEIAEMQMVRREPHELRPGLSGDEIKTIVGEMKNHPDLAHIPSHKLDIAEQVLNKHLGSQH